MASHPSRGFSLFQLLWSNLRARPLRTSVSVVGVALQIFLVLFIVGLTSGVIREWADRVEGVGADVLVQPPNASVFFALSGAVMEESLGSQLARVPGVEAVAPVLVMVETTKLNLIYGIDFDSFNSLSSGFEFLEGGPFTSDNQVIIDDIRARQSRLKLGDRIPLQGQEFTVCGIVVHGKGARFFIPLRKAQEIGGAEARVSLFYVRSNGDTEAAREAIAALLPSHRVRALEEYLTLMNSSNLPELRPFIRTMVVLGVIISFLVVLLTVYTTVLERTREIGILKALGASRSDIVGLILGETLAMALLGVVAGLAVTFGVKSLLAGAVPSLSVLISADWILRATLLAFLGASAGAIYPAFHAAGYDPVDALAYE